MKTGVYRMLSLVYDRRQALAAATKPATWFNVYHRNHAHGLKCCKTDIFNTHKSMQAYYEIKLMK